MANWVKDTEGDLINLDLVNCISCTQNMVYARVITHADLVDVDYTLFRGTPEECGKFRDELYRRIGLRDLHGHPPV